MYKLTASLSLLFAAVGTFTAAQVPGGSTEINFVSMDLSVPKGGAAVQRLDFELSFEEYNDVFSCTADLTVEDYVITGRCSSKDSSALKLWVKRPLPTVRRTWGGWDAEIEDTLLLNLEYINAESSQRGEVFSVNVPTEHLRNKQKNSQEFVFSSPYFLTFGEEAQLLFRYGG